MSYARFAPGRLLDDHGNEIQRPLNHFCVSLLQFNVDESGQVLEGHRFVRNLRVVTIQSTTWSSRTNGFHLAHGIGILEIRTPSPHPDSDIGQPGSFRRV